MSISLQKGQKISLTKDNGSLTKIMIGLGWDQVKPAKKGFFSAKPADIDCDASVIMLQNGKLRSTGSGVFRKSEAQIRSHTAHGG